jgi:hypothetical protein
VFEASRITSNTARAFGQAARETVQVQGEDQQHIEGGVGFGGGSSSSGAGGRAGGGTTTSGTGAETTTTTKNTVNLSDTVSGVTEKDRKKS